MSSSRRRNILWIRRSSFLQGSGIRDRGSGIRDQGPGTRDQGPGTRDQGIAQSCAFRGASGLLASLFGRVCRDKKTIHEHCPGDARRVGGSEGGARGPNGRGLCRWCSLEVPKRPIHVLLGILRARVEAPHSTRICARTGVQARQGNLLMLRHQHACRGAAPAVCTRRQPQGSAGTLGAEGAHAEESLGCGSHCAGG